MHHHRVRVIGLAAAAAIVLLASAPLDAQSFKTPWGDPDLQGTWTNQTLTPLERPAEFAGKPVLTEAEGGRVRGAAAAAEQRRHSHAGHATGRDGRLQRRVVGPRRADRRRPAHVAHRRSGGREDSAADTGGARREPRRPGPRTPRSATIRRRREDLDVYSRCIIRSALPRLSTGYNNNYEIVQTPGYVAILQEQIHDTRIIPLDGRPHLPGTVRQWLGDSRGRWEGDTLVVETTNFTDEASGSTFRDATKNMVLVERFRRVDADTIDYQFTVTDPETWTRPWTVKMPWNKVDGLMYEYACHEGNYGLANTLRSARVAEKAAQQK